MVYGLYLWVGVLAGEKNTPYWPWSGCDYQILKSLKHLHVVTKLNFSILFPFIKSCSMCTISFSWRIFWGLFGQRSTQLARGSWNRGSWSSRRFPSRLPIGRCWCATSPKQKLRGRIGPFFLFLLLATWTRCLWRDPFEFSSSSGWCNRRSCYAISSIGWRRFPKSISCWFRSQESTWGRIFQWGPWRLS